MKAYTSKRSNRIYSEPIEVNGLLYVEILKPGLHDHLTKGEVVAWGDTFPASHMREIQFEDTNEK